MISKQNLTEPDVKLAVLKSLQEKGYKVKDLREMNKTGPDLHMVGRNNGRSIWVEAKGETGAKSEMENKIIRGIGQLVTKFRKHPNHYYALAVPYTWKKRVAAKVNRDAMRVLNLRIYLVKIDGTVIEVTANRRYLLTQ